MINNIFIWGSKSYALLINEILKSHTKSLNLKYLKSNSKSLKVKTIFDPYAKKSTYKLEGTFFNKISDFKKNVKKCKSFIVCIGDNFGKARYFTSRFMERYGLKPLTLVSKHSLIDSKAKIGIGVVAMPNSYVNAFTEIGDYSILNSNANIEHECKLGKGNHIMSGACVGGRCIVGDYVTIGTNATILPDIKIGTGSYIGAGSVVTKNVKKNSVIIGVPGKYIKQSENRVDQEILKKILNLK
jgi:sugar O-acyltransferase (sialic acid O-acetyltransferase NeuD family)